MFKDNFAIKIPFFFLQTKKKFNYRNDKEISRSIPRHIIHTNRVVTTKKDYRRES